MKETFDIIIKDNFLDQDLHKKIHLLINRYNYHPNDNYIEGVDHIWFSCPVEKEIKEIVKNKCEEIWNKKFKVRFCSYTMLATVKPVVHNDYSDECDYQIIIYIKGIETYTYK